MECSIASFQKQIEEATVSHASEIAATKDSMRIQFQEEKDQLMNHMRELTDQKQKVDKEVRQKYGFLD